MSKRNRTIALAASALMAATLVAGCGSSSKAGDSTTTTAPANKGFDISTPEGSASLSLNGNLPPDWPSGFPVPSDADPAGSGSLSGSSNGGMVAVYTVSGSASDTYDFYKSNSTLDVTKATKYGVGSAFIGTVQFTGAYAGSANIAGRNDKTYLVVVLNTAEAATTTVPSPGTNTLAPG